MEAVAHELANAGGMSIDEFEAAFYEIEIGERLRQRDVNIISRARCLRVYSIQTIFIQNSCQVRKYSFCFEG
jgi:hypothetical protein